MKTTEKEYVPFGPEWEKELMKFRKKDLIDWIRKLIVDHRSIDEAYANGYNEAIGEASEEIREHYHPNTGLK